MSQAGYEFLPDKGDSIFRYRVWGLWDAQIVDRFERDFRRAMELGSAIRCILVDSRDMPVQSQDVINRLQRMDRGISPHQQRCAIVMEGALRARQVKRLNEGVETEFFENEADAVTWLKMT